MESNEFCESKFAMAHIGIHIGIVWKETIEEVLLVAREKLLRAKLFKGRHRIQFSSIEFHPFPFFVNKCKVFH